MIFSSLILTSLGENLSLSFLATSCVILSADSGTFSACSFGTIRAWPLLSGFSSSIAMQSLSSEIL